MWEPTNNERHLKRSLTRKIKEGVERDFRENQFQRRQTQKGKPLLDQWFDDYWLINVENSSLQLEKKVENLIEMLIELGDE